MTDSQNLNHLEQERDALQAYIRELHARIDDLLEGEPIDSLNRDINGLLAPFNDTNGWIEKAARALEDVRYDSPQTSLVRRDARKQAEILYEVSRDPYFSKALVTQIANGLAQQAEKQQ